MADNHDLEPDLEQALAEQEFPKTVEIIIANPRIGQDPILHAVCDDSRTRSSVNTTLLERFELVQGQLEDDISEVKLAWGKLDGGETFHTNFIVVNEQSELVILGQKECLLVFAEDDDEEPESYPIYPLGEKDEKATEQRKQRTDDETKKELEDAIAKAAKGLQDPKESKKKSSNKPNNNTPT